jgi:hypothetical protein
MAAQPVKTNLGRPRKNQDGKNFQLERSIYQMYVLGVSLSSKQLCMHIKYM